jgi:hypothetical protein
VKITEKHYSPWVKARQDQLALSVRNAWATLEAVPAKRTAWNKAKLLSFGA